MVQEQVLQVVLVVEVDLVKVALLQVEQETLLPLVQHKELLVVHLDLIQEIIQVLVVVEQPLLELMQEQMLEQEVQEHPIQF
tara:strand:+ start:186 stop:431 length:246 start_codon:yes stop_codon:yes gene_type:complete